MWKEIFENISMVTLLSKMIFDTWKDRGSISVLRIFFYAFWHSNLKKVGNRILSVICWQQCCHRQSYKIIYFNLTGFSNIQPSKNPSSTSDIKLPKNTPFFPFPLTPWKNGPQPASLLHRLSLFLGENDFKKIQYFRLQYRVWQLLTMLHIELISKKKSWEQGTIWCLEHNLTTLPFFQPN